MSDRDVEKIMMLASCTEEDARLALSKTGDIVEALDLIMVVPVTRGAPIKKPVSKEQAVFMEIRKNMELIDKSIHSNLTKSNQSDSSSQVLTHNHAPVQEGMRLHSDYTQNSQIPTQEEEVQKPETAYQ